MGQRGIGAGIGRLDPGAGTGAGIDQCSSPPIDQRLAAGRPRSLTKPVDPADRPMPIEG
jgi:hypothetical protein